MGYMLCDVNGRRTWQVNRQWKWLRPARWTAVQTKENKKRQTFETPKTFRQLNTKRTDHQISFDSESFYALCCCSSAPLPTSHTQTWPFKITTLGSFEMSGNIHPTDRQTCRRRTESSATPLWVGSTVRSSTPGRANKGVRVFPQLLQATAGTETLQELQLHFFVCRSISLFNTISYL